MPQQQGFWLEEMLFVKQLYLDPDLQRLATDSPKLCRGNIGFRPDLSKPYRPLPRILIAAPYLPFPLSHGGAVQDLQPVQSPRRPGGLHLCFLPRNH